MRSSRFRISLITLATAIAVSGSPELRAAPIESLGVERCAGREPKLQVEFVAPESTPVQVLAKAKRAGVTDDSLVPVLSLDGKPCSNGRCALSAVKGQTYQLIVDGAGLGFDDLCVSVQRP